MPIVFSLQYFTSTRSTTAADNPLRQEELFLEGRNGCAVLLIHGLTGTPHEMQFLASYLHREGYTVMCPRLANHGEPMHILQRTTWRDCYASVRTAWHVLRTERRHAGPIFAVGLSMGGLLALLLADEFPDGIAGVSCLSPTLFYDGWNMPWSKHLLPVAYYTPLKHLFYFKEEPPYGIKSTAVRERLQRYYSTARLDDLRDVAQFGYPYFPVALLCQLHSLVQHLAKRLPHITTPVQLVQAHEDDMTSPRNSQFIYDRISSTIKEIVPLYNSYHIVTADQERQTVARRMEAFFQRVHPSTPIADETSYTATS